MFLNRNKQKFVWENDDLDNSDGLIEYSLPEIPAQMPVIDLEVEKDINRDLIKILGPREEEISFDLV